jgi:hypothetical protein
MPISKIPIVNVLEDIPKALLNGFLEESPPVAKENKFY